MATAMASTTTSPSLLSRMMPLEAPLPSRERMGSMPTKRSISEEDDEKSLKRRRSNEQTTNLRAHYIPWLKVTGDSGGATREERLHDELLQFVEYISPSRQEREAHKMLVARIESLLKTRWPDVRVTVFGSSSTGLELTGGDIDLVVSFDSAYTLFEADRKKRLAAMGDMLRRSGMTKWVNRIFGARVPIVSFMTTEELGEVHVDISIRNEEDTGIRAIPLVKQFLTEMPALKPLILAVKALLSLRDLNDASQGTLSSYAITLMCISLLQRNPGRRPRKQLDDPYTEKTLGILFMDFLRHYGHDFSYATHYISVTDKGVFPKKAKSWEVKPGNPAVLAVQCMLHPENNITRGCGKIALIVDAFKDALYALQNAPTGDKSILHFIYEASEEDDDRRRLLDESVDSGTFSQSVAACSADVGRHAVSGGVRLSTNTPATTRSNNDPNARSLLMRLGPGPLLGEGRVAHPSSFTPSVDSGIQQLPPLRWQDKQRPAAAQLPSKDFDFQLQAPYFNGAGSGYPTFPAQETTMHADIMKQGIYPTHESMIAFPTHRNNRNDPTFAVLNHLVPQQNRRPGRTYVGRH